MTGDLCLEWDTDCTQFGERHWQRPELLCSNGFMLLHQVAFASGQLPHELEKVNAVWIQSEFPRQTASPKVTSQKESSLTLLCFVQKKKMQYNKINWMQGMDGDSWGKRRQAAFF